MFEYKNKNKKISKNHTKKFDTTIEKNTKFKITTSILNILEKKVTSFDNIISDCLVSSTLTKHKVKMQQNSIFNVV